MKLREIVNNRPYAILKTTNDKGEEVDKPNVDFRVQDTRGGELCSCLIFTNNQLD